MRRKAAPALAGARPTELCGHHPHPPTRTPPAGGPSSRPPPHPPGRAPYLGCSQVGSATGPMGRRHQVCQRRPERNTHRGAREEWLSGWAAWRGRAGPLRTQQFTKKKKTQVVQQAPEENRVREVPEAARASSTTTASGVRLVREAGLGWRGP